MLKELKEKESSVREQVDHLTNELEDVKQRNDNLEKELQNRDSTIDQVRKRITANCE
jgi:peptidoglycan hydrolase CwlO-like protein